MSWQISLVRNTVKVCKECAQEVLKKVYWEGELSDIYESSGSLLFYEDWMEHQDYIPQVVDIFKKYKVSGDIAFCTTDGGPSLKNTVWIHQFDNGVYTYVSKKIDDLI